VNTRMSAYVDDELAELLAEIYVLYPFVEEGSDSIHVLCVVSIHRGKCNGIRAYLASPACLAAAMRRKATLRFASLRLALRASTSMRL